MPATRLGQEPDARGFNSRSHNGALEAPHRRALQLTLRASGAAVNVNRSKLATRSGAAQDGDLKRRRLRAISLRRERPAAGWTGTGRFARQGQIHEQN